MRTGTRLTRFNIPRSLSNDWDGDPNYQADHDLLGARVARAFGWENRARGPMFKVGSQGSVNGDHRYLMVTR